MPLKIELPVLVSLNIRYPGLGDDADYVSNLWAYLSVPALEDLTLNNFNNPELHESMAAMKEQRDKGPIAEVKTLCLEDTFMDHYAAEDYEPEDFYTTNSMVDDLMLAFPNVTCLVLTGDSVVSVLTLMLETDRKNISSDAISLWPYLQRLIVALPEEKLIRDVILARRAVGHPIAELHIQVAEGFPAKSIRWLRRRVQSFSMPKHISRAGMVRLPVIFVNTQTVENRSRDSIIPCCSNDSSTNRAPYITVKCTCSSPKNCC